MTNNSLVQCLWRLAFAADLPQGLSNPIDPLWAVTFGAGKPPEDALGRLAAVYGLEAPTEADTPEEAPAPRRTRRHTTA